MQVRKKDGENMGSLLYRFSKKVQQGGVLIEAKKRRFKHRPQSRLKRKIAALYRVQKNKEVERAKKMGLL